MNFNQRRQLCQLRKLDGRIHAAVVTAIRVAPDLIGLAIALGYQAYVAQLERQAMKQHEENHTYEGFAHAPGDGGTKATDYDSDPSVEYMRMLAQEMDRRSLVDENRQPKNVGDDISRMLGQPIQPEEDSMIEITEAQKVVGLNQALRSQQPRNEKGSLPVKWL